MATVTAALVKELRERTGAGMMECKKALVEANADIELAIENMRKSGAAKAAKKLVTLQLKAQSSSKKKMALLFFLKLTAKLTSLLKTVTSLHSQTK